MLYAEIKAIQSGQMGDEQLLEMWKEIEKEQDLQRIQEMKLENQLRERELKKQDLQRSWRTGNAAHNSSSSTNSLKSSTDTTTVDMDVEEIIGSVKPISQMTGTTSTQIPTGTSPLLTSLLKSPTTSTPTNISASPSVRNSAPTITTLLTSGSIPNTNQPAIIASGDGAVQLLTRPISGPPMDTISAPVAVTQQLLSPSQSAPTLSMLLEKNKNVAPNTIETKNSELEENSISKTLDTSICNDSNNESIPMDIEEDIPAAKVEISPDIDDTDPNEEQQLLEVFKNIGNIEELDIDVSDVIDEEVDFLKGVDEEAPIDDNLDLEEKFEQNLTTELGSDLKLPTDLASIVDNKDHGEVKNSSTSNSEDIKSETTTKVDIISSDDSNDNIPLAAVASLESSKDRLNMNESSNEEAFLKDQVESAILKNEQDQVESGNDSTSVSSLAIKQEMLDENEKYNVKEEDIDNLKSISETKDEVFVVPSTEDEKQERLFKSEDDSQDVDGSQQDQKDNKSDGKNEDEDNMNGKFSFNKYIVQFLFLNKNSCTNFFGI